MRNKVNVDDEEVVCDAIAMIALLFVKLRR